MRRFGIAAMVCSLAACGLEDGVVTQTEVPLDEAAGELRVLSAAEIVGDLQPGTTATASHSGTPRYRAFRFNAPAGTRASVWVRSTNGDAQAWLLAANFRTLARNDDAGDGSTNSHLEYPLRTGGIYYVAFRELKGNSATFAVSLTFVSSGVVDAGGGAPDAGAASGHLIDWCGNGLDEDGDGHDRACSTGTVLPVELRQVVVSSTGSFASVELIGQVTASAFSNGSGSGLVPEARVAFPRDVISKIRVENQSPYPVWVYPWPRIPGDWQVSLAPQRGTQVDSAVVDVRPGYRYRVEATASFLLDLQAVFSEPQAATLSSQQAVLEGTMTDGLHRVTPVRVTVVPEVGVNCGSAQQNTVHSIDECAGQSSCFARSRIEVEALPTAAGGAPALLNRYLPAQCNLPPAPGQSYGVGWNSRVIWENRALSITGFGTGTGESHELTLHFDPGTPGLVVGTARGGGYDAFAGGTTFALRFVARP